MADIGFEVSGRIMQQLALRLVPRQKVVTWVSAVIAHDQAIALGDAGHPDLVMAANLGDEPARLVLSPGGAGRCIRPEQTGGARVAAAGELSCSGAGRTHAALFVCQGAGLCAQA